MMRTPQKTETGFTLLETLVYLALFSVVIMGTVLATVAVVSVSDTTQAQAVLQQETDFLTRKLYSEFAKATAVASPSVGATSSVLSLVTADGSVDFDLHATSLRIRRGTGSWSSLNSTNVQVHDLVFEHLVPTASKSGGLKISFEVADAYRGQEPVELTFYFPR